MTTYSAEYRAVLGSPRWATLRAAALRRARYRCEKCGRSRRQTIGPLDTHHANGYADLGAERLSDLLVLCRYPCHERAHGRPGFGRCAWRWWWRPATLARALVAAIVLDIAATAYIDLGMDLIAIARRMLGV